MNSLKFNYYRFAMSSTKSPHKAFLGYRESRQNEVKKE